MKEYWVLLGAFGSGKSELALNMAIRAAKQGPCTLVDLDVINPYFRTSERGDVLTPAGVELIMPPFALDKIEILSLSARVYAAFTPGEGSVFLTSAAITWAPSRWDSTSRTFRRSRRKSCTCCSS